MGTLVLLLVVCATVQKVQAQKQAYVQVHAGLYSAALRDKAYSPLMYFGVGKAAGLTARFDQSAASRLFCFTYSSGQYANRYSSGMGAKSVSFQTYTFYHSESKKRFIRFGWSNQNVFISRDLESVQNFNNRSDYHTSFGPAARIGHEFRILNLELGLDIMFHIQLLGFFVASSYVTSLPPGFEGPPKSWYKGFLSSMDLFYPGNSMALGTWPSLRCRFGKGNQAGFSYNYNYQSINGSHQSQKSGGVWLVELHVAL